MKTLGPTTALLLLILCSSSTMAQGGICSPNNECCTSFCSFQVPQMRVAAIRKTPITCPEKGFIVETVMGRLFCYKENVQWAQELFDKH